MIEKVTGIGYTPLLKPSDSNPVTRECAEVTKKRNLIVTRGSPGAYSLRLLKTVSFMKQRILLFSQIP